MVQLLWERWLGNGPLLEVLGRGETTEGRVGPVGVVLVPPRFHNNLGLEERTNSSTLSSSSRARR